MLLSERLLAENRRLLKEKEKADEIQQDQDEDEMGYAYQDRPPFVFLNNNKGIFVNPDDNSLNTAPSVFDKTAIFKTR